MERLLYEIWRRGNREKKYVSLQHNEAAKAGFVAESQFVMSSINEVRLNHDSNTLCYFLYQREIQFADKMLQWELFIKHKIQLATDHYKGTWVYTTKQNEVRFLHSKCWYPRSIDERLLDLGYEPEELMMCMALNGLPMLLFTATWYQMVSQMFCTCPFLRVLIARNHNLRGFSAYLHAYVLNETA